MHASKRYLKPLLGFGSWLTVTNTVSPLMTYIDRFFVSALLGLTSVAYYTTPYDMLTRTLMFSQALTGVLFPALVSARTSADKMAYANVYDQSTKILTLSILPISVLVFLGAPEILTIWLGVDFASHSTLAVQWLCVGITVNSGARAPFTALQSAGAPDLVAKLHLVEIAPYVACLYYLTLNFGIAGTAAAWTLRIIFDYIALNAVLYYKIANFRRTVIWSLVTTAAIALGFFSAWWIDGLIARSIVLVLFLCIFAYRSYNQVKLLIVGLLV